MESKPVQDSDQPRYPTRREVLAGAASFALVNLAGCNFAVAEPESGKAIVAPVFAHGEGRGVTGCDVVVPPVFLSEEEAMQILREELAWHGIQLKSGDALQGVRVPARTEKYEMTGKAGGTQEPKRSVAEVPDRAEPLKPSGIDVKRGIAVEFVSEKNYVRLGGTGVTGVVDRYNFKDAAEYVAAKVKQQGKDRIVLGVFYDPSPKLPEVQPADKGGNVDRQTQLMKRLAEGKAESQKLLRQQAQDFVKWLKEQKAIR